MFKNLLTTIKNSLNKHEVHLPTFVVYSNIVFMFILVYSISYNYLIYNFQYNKKYVGLTVFNFFLSLLLFRNHIIKKINFSIKKNKFGDILISLIDSKNDKNDKNVQSIKTLTNEEKYNAIYTGFIPNGSSFIATHPEKGDIYGFDKTLEHFPFVYNGIIRGSSCLLTFFYLDRKWIILVKPRDRKYLMNPSGGINLNSNINYGLDGLDTLHKNTAKDEVFEETGCVIKTCSLVLLANWLSPRPYFNLEWNSWTYAYLSECDIFSIPKYILNVLNTKDNIYTISLPENEGYDTDEISDLVICEENSIDKLIFEGIDINYYRHDNIDTKSDKISISSHHSVVILKGLNIYNPDKHKELLDKPYLLEFNWCI